MKKDFKIFIICQYVWINQGFFVVSYSLLMYIRETLYATFFNIKHISQIFAALNAIRVNPIIRRFCEEHKGKLKGKKLIIACERKLVIITWAVLYY
ncbi:hypothetical protein Stok01_01349 [Sulfurisphaera tokodaii]